MQEDEEGDIPADASAAVALPDSPEEKGTEGKRNLAQIAKGAIFREVVLAKVREAKEQEEAAQVEKEVQDKAGHKSHE